MKPILFSTPMVQAVLNGTKTQTRRKEKLLINVDHDSGYTYFKYKGSYGRVDIHNWEDRLIRFNPYGMIGDILWVRETFQIECGREDDPIKYNYRADGETLLPWKPSIFMPKDACRIFLKIVDIRIEQLYDISYNDSVKEGVEVVRNNSDDKPMYKNYLHNNLQESDPVNSFKTLWEFINGKESWDSNPWVWVVDYERTEKP